MLRLRGGAGDGYFCEGCSEEQRSGSEFVDHLEASRNCHLADGFSRPISVAISKFNCLFCPLESYKRLKTHLKSEGCQCFHQYLDLFHLDLMDGKERCLDLISKQITKEKRQFQPSRSTNHRRTEAKKGAEAFVRKCIVGAATKRCANCNAASTSKQLMESGWCRGCSQPPVTELDPLVTSNCYSDGNDLYLYIFND